MSRFSCAVIALVAAALVGGSGGAAGAAGAAAPAPEFHVGGDDHRLGEANDLYFDVFDLQREAAPYSVAIRAPAGYDTTPVDRAGDRIGEAEVDVTRAAGGKPIAYTGPLEVTAAATFAADPATAACAPGTHAATWQLAVQSTDGALVIPIAVDQAGSAYRLTLCLGSTSTLSLKVSEIFFTTRGVFRNPRARGLYRFDATVSPHGPDGGADAASAYLLRADEPLPDAITAGPSYDPATKLLTVTGVATSAGRPRAGVNVHVFAGASSDSSKLQEVGMTGTSEAGAYTFTRKLSRAPTYLFVRIYHYHEPTCGQPTAVPGGCLSESIDGVASYLTRVVRAPLSARAGVA